MGRRKIDQEKKNRGVAISFSPEDLATLESLSKALAMDKSKVVRYLLRCCAYPENQTLRNVIVNMEVDERISKMMKNYGSAPNYITEVHGFTTFGDVKRATKSDLVTLDQQENTNKKMANLQHLWKLDCDFCDSHNIEKLSFDAWLKEHLEETSKERYDIGSEIKPLRIEQ